VAERRDRLDQPRVPRGIRRPRIDSERFGELSERLARYFGTARYLAIQTLMVIAWIAVNVAWGINWHNNHHSGSKPFDPYPFILLNLAFSTQAAYAAPLILLAQNRQADRDRIQAEADRAASARAVADTEYLARELASVRMALGEVVTRDFLRAELSRLEDRREDRREEHRDGRRDDSTGEGHSGRGSGSSGS
jgi:uncharacterized membrane protein